MKPFHAYLFAVLCLPAFASSQELPLAWPDRPEGTVLYVAPTAAFNGATLPMGAENLLLAWCDMRDGRGRLMLQSYPLDHPAAGGEWTTEMDGLGTVQALAHEPSTLTPFMPILAPDGQGGAYVLWHEMVTESWGELRLQRVSAEGQFLWQEDRLVAPAVPIPENDCRDASERCRSWTDNLRWMVADDQGLWVIWRDLDQRRWTLRLSPDGQLAPGFPPAGVELIPGSQTRRYHSQGTTLLFTWQEGNPPAARGMVQGLLPDESQGYLEGASQDEQGLVYRHQEGQLDYLQRLSVDGGESGRWGWPLDGNLMLDAAAFVFHGAQQALVTVSGEYKDELGSQASAYLLNEDGTSETLFDAPIHPVPRVARRPRLVAAPAGDVLLQWHDYRGYAQGYGYQTRLARLDVLDAGSPVSPTTRPDRLQLASAHPL